MSLDKKLKSREKVSKLGLIPLREVVKELGRHQLTLEYHLKAAGFTIHYLRLRYRKWITKEAYDYLRNHKDDDFRITTGEWKKNAE